MKYKSSSFTLNPELTRQLLYLSRISPTSFSDMNIDIDTAYKEKTLKKGSSIRINKDALELTTELLRQFIIEARQRAAVEADFEWEDKHVMGRISSGSIIHSGKDKTNIKSRTFSDKQEYFFDENKKTYDKNIVDLKINPKNTTEETDSGQNWKSQSKKIIEPRHVIKIAAELLLDFS